MARSFANTAAVIGISLAIALGGLMLYARHMSPQWTRFFLHPRVGRTVLTAIYHVRTRRGLTREQRDLSHYRVFVDGDTENETVTFMPRPADAPGGNNVPEGVAFELHVVVNRRTMTVTRFYAGAD